MAAEHILFWAGVVVVSVLVLIWLPQDPRRRRGGSDIVFFIDCDNDNDDCDGDD